MGIGSVDTNSFMRVIVLITSCNIIYDFGHDHRGWNLEMLVCSVIEGFENDFLLGCYMIRLVYKLKKFGI